MDPELQAREEEERKQQVLDSQSAVEYMAEERDQYNIQKSEGQDARQREYEDNTNEDGTLKTSHEKKDAKEFGLKENVTNFLMLLLVVYRMLGTTLLTLVNTLTLNFIRKGLKGRTLMSLLLLLNSMNNHSPKLCGVD